jgi:hypothetical protein
MSDPANSRAQSRSKLGLTRELEQERTDLPPDPSIGGSRGYSIWFREKVLENAVMNGDDAAAAMFGCSTRSIQRWQTRLIPFRMSGGAEREKLTGYDQLLLVIGLFIYPSASSDQLCTFIVANGGDVYEREDVSRRCEDLSITRKRSSKEAYDAFSPSSLRKFRWFKTQPPPLGVHGFPVWILIDIDETGEYCPCNCV